MLLLCFCHNASLTPCPCPSLPTISRQRSKSGRRRPLISRSWYTRDTASLACWLRPWQGKCCLIVVFFDQPCSRPACACLSIYPTRTQQQQKLRAGGWRSGHAQGTAAGAGGHEGKLCLIVVFVVQPCSRPAPVSLASWLRPWTWPRSRPRSLLWPLSWTWPWL